LFRAGYSFRFPVQDGTIPHLWVVATDPDENGVLVIVNLTSLKGSKDQTVVIRSKEHPFVRWDTCVNYALADTSTTELLKSQHDCGVAHPHDAVSAGLLSLILDGFAASPRTKNRIRDFIKVQRRR
jgi:hypothetical protein